MEKTLDETEKCLNKFESPKIVQLNVETREAHKPNALPQIVATLIASLGYFNTGAVNGWSASSLTQLELEYVMGPTEFALVVSTITIGSLIASLLAGPVSDIIGRRRTIFLAGPLLISGWIMIGCSNSIYWVYIGRLLGGFATGLILTQCQMYASEISDKTSRGKLGSLLPLALTFGIAASYGACAFFHYRTSCFIFSVTSSLLFLVLLLPESPYWYLLKDRRNESIKSLKVLRGKHYDVEPELKEMEVKIHSVGVACSYREFFKRRTGIPLAVAIFINSLQQFTGGNILMMFTSKIFKEANSAIDPEFATLYTGIVQIIGTSFSLFLVDKLGRRPLLTLSSFFVGVCTLIVSIYFFLFSSNYSVSNWIPFVTVVILVFCYCLGCRSIPWLVTSELFNTSIRSRANAICVFYNRTLNFTIVQIYPHAKEAWGSHVVFLIFGCFGMIFGILAWFIVPETKNKTLEEIQSHFEDRALKAKEKSLLKKNPPKLLV